MKIFQTMKRFNKAANSFHKLVAVQIWARPMLCVHDERPAISLSSPEGDTDFIVNFNKKDGAILHRLARECDAMVNADGNKSNIEVFSYWVDYTFTASGRTIHAGIEAVTTDFEKAAEMARQDAARKHGNQVTSGRAVIKVSRVVLRGNQ